MSPSPTYLDSRRSPAGIIATFALHVGIAGIGLFAVTKTFAPAPPPPLVTTSHRDPVTATPAPTLPTAADPVGAPRIAEPVFTVDVTPPAASGTDSPSGEPVVVGIVENWGDGPQAKMASVPPPGPTTIARLDLRAGVQPPYPAAARRMGEEGSVVVHVLIGRDGRVLAASLGRSSGSARLDAAAVAHARQHWRFSPALQAGIAIEAERDITIRFRLDEAAA